MITIILIRHGKKLGRFHKERECHDPLSDDAREDAEKLGKTFARLAVVPHLVLTSEWAHSSETARRVASGSGSKIRVQEVKSLTPKTQCRRHWCDNLFEDLEGNGADTKCVCLVGHEPRLSQLVVRFTGKRDRQLEWLEAVCITAKDLRALWLGQGRIKWRYPVRNWLESEIREKLASKMMVATFLASANFVALFEILIAQREQLLRPRAGTGGASNASAGLIEECTLQTAARILNVQVPTESCGTQYLFSAAFLFIAAAAGLFIAAIYLYDRLGMPSGFWKLKPVKQDDLDADKREQLLIDGYPYGHMIRIWRCYFTPAVLCSVIGVTLAVLAVGTWWLFVAFLVTGWAGYHWYRQSEPTGDID